MIYAVLKTNHTLSIYSLFSIIIFFIALFFCFFILGLYKNDVFFGFLGFKNYISNERRLLRSVVIILIAAVISGAFLSSNKALIKLSLKPGPAPEINNQIQELPQYAPSEYRELAETFEEMYADKKNIIPDWVFELIYGIIKWSLIAVLVTGVIIFFFKPFFTAHWKQFWKEGRFIRFLKHIFEEFKEFLRYAFTRTNLDESYAAVSDEGKKFGEGIKDFLKRAGRSKEKNAEIDRLTKYFMRLIDWGQLHEIKYRPNLAPAEYTDLINSDAAKLAGSLFEKALYDKNVLTAEEEKQFVEAVEAVICG